MVRPFIISPGKLTFLASAYIAIVLNGAFWSGLIHAVHPNAVGEWLFIAALVVALVAIFNAVLSLAAFPYVLKSTLVMLVLVSAPVAFFAWEYGTAIDVNMLHNFLETDAKEAGDLVTPRFVGFVLLLGVIPAAVIAIIAVAWRPIVPTVVANSARAMISAATASVLIFAFFGTFVSVMRENRGLPLLLVPSNIFAAAGKYAVARYAEPPGALQAFGRDAHRSVVAGASRPLVTVLVVGETARSANFSLNGYGRPTNPRLAAIDGLVSLKHVTSCGTDTANSVPCMFSGLGQAAFSINKAASQENLLDMLRRVGFDVLWRDNQSGCKGVCRGVETELLSKRADRAFFDYGESHDEVLLEGLEDRLTAMTQGGVVVLHMMGSHGPAYFKRVPQTFAKFQPVCMSRQFSNCTNEQIVNSYDNTILYTDHVLAELIVMLRAVEAKGFDTAMIYVSDHGESLGEKGLYLHGLPRALAPKEQTHIPMMMWFSRSAHGRLNIDMECLQESAALRPASHDNLFHTMLGILDVKSRLYNANLDFLSRCRLKTIDGL